MEVAEGRRQQLEGLRGLPLVLVIQELGWGLALELQLAFIGVELRLELAREQEQELVTELVLVE